MGDKKSESVDELLEQLGKAQDDSALALRSVQLAQAHLKETQEHVVSIRATITRSVAHALHYQVLNVTTFAAERDGYVLIDAHDLKRLRDNQ